MVDALVGSKGCCWERRYVENNLRHDLCGSTRDTTKKKNTLISFRLGRPEISSAKIHQYRVVLQLHGLLVTDESMMDVTVGDSDTLRSQFC